MTSLAQVTALVDAHVNRDHARFRAVTLQIAANVSGRSEQGAAQLRKLVDRVQDRSLEILPCGRGLLTAPPELAVLTDTVLSPSTRDPLDRVLQEYAQRDVLRVHSLRPARKLLFTGPPGVGKTMTAGAIARAVELPMFRVDSHTVIASHLGETSANLSKVFEHVRMLPAVYLFDEFDSIGGDRRSLRDGSSVGAEMHRVVNSLLQLVEDDRSESLIIAATNLEQLLDQAIFRRFDEVIAFALPTREEVVELHRRSLIDVDIDQLDFEAICTVTEASKLGHADVCAALDRVLKDRVIAGVQIDTTRVVEGLTRRSRVPS